MKKTIVTAITSVLGLTLLLGVLYPLVITGIGQAAFPGNANGQLVYEGGKLVASKEIGQQFTRKIRRHQIGDRQVGDRDPQASHSDLRKTVLVADKRYFQTRPSGNVPADGDGGTEFANLGPNDRATAQAIAANMKAYLALNRPYDGGLTASQIPVDAADTSASGVDPDISPANAAIQAHRVAAVRHLPLEQVTALVQRFTGGRGLGFSGEPAVNVVELNLALDHIQGH